MPHQKRTALEEHAAHSAARLAAVPYVAAIMRELAASLRVDVRELRVPGEVERVVLELIKDERDASSRKLLELHRSYEDTIFQLEQRLETRPVGERVTLPSELEPFGDEPTRRLRRLPSGVMPKR